jgi:hypothetical protein
VYSKSLSTHAEFDYSRAGPFGLADADGSKKWSRGYSRYLVRLGGFRHPGPPPLRAVLLGPRPYSVSATNSLDGIFVQSHFN